MHNFQFLSNQTSKTLNKFHRPHRYIYTNVLKDLDLSELFETFMAGDKYQVYNMNDAMFSFIKHILNPSNCCIIYDQLMKFPTDYVCVPLDQVETIIRCNSASAFKNKHFVKISQDTLLNLLSMDALSIDEIDVLTSCAKWVDEEIKRLNLESNTTNKQTVFEPIKNLIRFSKITFDQLKSCNPIKDLLSRDELCSLFLHLLNVSKFTIECNTARKKVELKSASCKNYQLDSYSRYFSELSSIFKASDSIIIKNVYTFLPTHVQDLEFSINDMVNGLKNVELNYEKLHSKSGNCWYFRFIDAVKIDATKDYKFVFKFKNAAIYSVLSLDTEMIVNDSSLECKLSSTDGYHCLKKIDFYQIS